MVLGVVFVVTSRGIGESVQAKCEQAKKKYGGDCVESLKESLQDEENSYRERNGAIWALGQLGDERGKEVIEGYYTGVIPEREPYDEGLSQYEMKKALGLLSGGWNATHLVWKITQ